VSDRVVSVLDRTVRFNDTGLLDSITSRFSRNVDATDAPGRELLAGPIEFVVETPTGQVIWTGKPPRILSESSGSVIWETTSTGGPLRLSRRARMECHGYVNSKLTVQALKPSDLKDLRFEIPLRREVAIYMMAMGRKGGYHPPTWEWRWDPALANNQLWIGDVNADPSCQHQESIVS
jgi:hypothetical protein